MSSIREPFRIRSRPFWDSTNAALARSTSALALRASCSNPSRRSRSITPASASDRLRSSRSRAKSSRAWALTTSARDRLTRASASAISSGRLPVWASASLAWARAKPAWARASCARSSASSIRAITWPFCTASPCSTYNSSSRPEVLGLRFTVWIGRIVPLASILTVKSAEVTGTVSLAKGSTAGSAGLRNCHRPQPAAPKMAVAATPNKGQNKRRDRCSHWFSSWSAEGEAGGADPESESAAGALDGDRWAVPDRPAFDRWVSG